jgi:hypothetical protein
MGLNKDKLRKYAGTSLHPERILGMNDGYRMLAIAVVNQAIIDYRDCSHHSSMAKKAGAKYWLLNQAADWLDAVGVHIDAEWWCCWINNRCPRPSNKHIL